MSARIALLGTGLMGTPMALNLLSAGHVVTVWNRTPEKTAPLVERGATAAPAPAQAVERAELVITMLADGPAVAEVLFERGVAASVPAGALVVDMSSIPPGFARRHAAHLRERGVGHLDAPVSGGTVGAEAGTLAIMAGGERSDFERARGVLEALGRPLHVGPDGSGQLAKLVNQLIVAVTIGAVAEGLLLAGAGGADPAAVRHALRGGFAESRVLELHGERMLTRNFEPGGRTRMQLKDLNTVVDVAGELGLELPLALETRALFRSLSDGGGGDLDHSALLLELERRNASPPDSGSVAPRPASERG